MREARANRTEEVQKEEVVSTRTKNKSKRKSKRAASKADRRRRPANTPAARRRRPQVSGPATPDYVPPQRQPGPRSPVTIAEFIVASGGATMAQLEEKFGIKAHPMRSKLFSARHDFGYAIDYDAKAKRYSASAPQKRAG
jgi:hypothetical protein